MEQFKSAMTPESCCEESTKMLAHDWYAEGTNPTGPGQPVGPNDPLNPGPPRHPQTNPAPVRHPAGPARTNPSVPGRHRTGYFIEPPFASAA